MRRSDCCRRPTALRRGYRPYVDEFVESFYRICVLRRLEMPLLEIEQAPNGDAWSLAGALHSHLDDLDARPDTAKRHRSGLARLLAESAHEQLPTNDLLEVLRRPLRITGTSERASHQLAASDALDARSWVPRTRTSSSFLASSLAGSAV